MEFLNPEIDTSAIPPAEHVSFNAVEPDYFKVVQLSWLVSTIISGAILAAVIYFVRFLHDLEYIVGISVIWLSYVIFRYIAHQKAFRNLGYSLREHDIIHRSGWFVERIRTAPFKRVQHSNVAAGPIERKYGLATLILYTAGTEGADLKIAGLKREEAFRLKDWITQKVLHEN